MFVVLQVRMQFGFIASLLPFPFAGTWMFGLQANVVVQISERRRGKYEHLR